MGGFLTIGYCFLEIFVGGQGLDGGGQSRDGDPPTGENPACLNSPLDVWNSCRAYVC